MSENKSESEKNSWKSGLTGGVDSKPGDKTPDTSGDYKVGEENSAGHQNDYKGETKPK